MAPPSAFQSSPTQAEALPNICRRLRDGAPETLDPRTNKRYSETGLHTPKGHQDQGTVLPGFLCAFRACSDSCMPKVDYGRQEQSLKSRRSPNLHGAIARATVMTPIPLGCRCCLLSGAFCTFRPAGHLILLPLLRLLSSYIEGYIEVEETVATRENQSKLSASLLKRVAENFLWFPQVANGFLLPI
ncbi:hypothetical protein CRG98_003114 [Punica granatum]|uniref:Uncharacterized protein n=1 Tax=Punica granatum TaxID=22663 RepID=A0A2I0L8P3_PUNGR|nr:hypothetical protein CRG98_003114 [Punica granatum]